ncbi:S-layer region-like protein [Limnospira maxima CS-328]|uniref:S-layer region-like protein n=1 Tax=Limnospira maxima CS-328 TaxID=513049 RepID=B5WA88_LIMMA|nr:S-layer region-like protein [Limnospira maxima CS-328]
MTNKILWKTLHSPSLVGAALLLSAGSALATEKIATKFDMTSQVDPVTTEEIEESISPESNVAIALMSEPPSQPLELAQIQPETEPEISILGIEQINQYSGLEDSMEQVTSVSQLSDVQPTDWAFQALQSLVERYGCIAVIPTNL